MENRLKILLIGLFGMVIFLESCTVQERRYTKGFYVNWKKKNPNVEEKEKSYDAISVINIKQKLIVDTAVNNMVVSNCKMHPFVVNEHRSMKLQIVADTCGDILVLVDGTVIVARIIEISETELKYKKCNNLEGPIYSVNPNKVNRIEYSNGKKEYFNENEISKSGATLSNGQKKVSESKDSVNPMAIASFIMSLLSFLIIPAIITGPLALIFGEIALKQISEGKGSKGRGLATFGIVIGSIVVFILILLIALTFAL